MKLVKQVSYMSYVRNKILVEGRTTVFIRLFIRGCSATSLGYDDNLT